jgi:glycosyltransferase involved in cell wall biosynthesis
MTPCFNEEANVRELHEAVKGQLHAAGILEWEHVFIDNASTDGTVTVLRELAASDPRIRVIVNSRNFGPLRSSYHGFLACRGDAVIPIAADLQDPPELIPEFIRRWRAGDEVVIAVKESAGESRLMYTVRRAYYRLVNRLSEVALVENYYGYGLYDRRIVDALRSFDNPYPYFRGLVAEVGFRQSQVLFHQPTRKRGVSSYSLYKLYDVAMLGITSHSKVPLRLATLVGFVMSGLSLLVGAAYLAAKLLFWNYFTVGVAPIIISIFFFGSVQLFFTGVLGEYIGFIYTHVMKRPLVIERERINFDAPAPPGAPQ